MTPLVRDAMEVRGRFDRRSGPLTWDYLNAHDGGPRDFAAVTCPKNHISRLTNATHTVDHDGNVSPSLRCMHDGCDFHDHVRLVGWDADEFRSGSS